MGNSSIKVSSTQLMRGGINPKTSSSQSLHSFELSASRSSSGLPSPFKRRRSSAANSQQGHGETVPLEKSDLRGACIAVLADIILEDCRYKTRRPRLLAPPNALQAVCLDVALAIIEAQPQPQTLAAVASAVIPAFDTFEPGLFPRIMAFFEDGILRGMLAQLRRAQDLPEVSTHHRQGDAVHAPS